jgi:hypothetical protein
MNERDSLLVTIQAQYDADPTAPPVVTLDQYFIGTRSLCA